ncbi:MAG: hypothetical protein AAGJ11_05750 [Bacteroidota bacterium]
MEAVRTALVEETGLDLVAVERPVEWIVVRPAGPEAEQGGRQVRGS